MPSLIGLRIEKKRHGYDFTHIRQTGSLEDFHFTWDLLTAQVDLSEDYMVDVYLFALKSEIERVVRIFNPKTLTEARRLAHMQENLLEKQTGHSKTCPSPLSSLLTKSKPLLNYKNTIISCGQPTSPTSFEAYSSTTNSPMEAFMAETPLAREELVLGHSNNSSFGIKNQGKMLEQVYSGGLNTNKKEKYSMGFPSILHSLRLKFSHTILPNE